MLLEPERGVPRARDREHRADRIVALRVRERVAAALGDGELRIRALRDLLRRTVRLRATRSRISRCGSRGPESEPAPSSAPRRYAPRQHERPTTRFGGTSSGAPDGESTPASRRTASAVASTVTWSW